jgi:hypothetical protein
MGPAGPRSGPVSALAFNAFARFSTPSFSLRVYLLTLGICTYLARDTSLSKRVRGRTFNFDSISNPHSCPVNVDGREPRDEPWHVCMLLTG